MSSSPRSPKAKQPQSPAPQADRDPRFHSTFWRVGRNTAYLYTENPQVSKWIEGTLGVKPMATYYWGRSVSAAQFKLTLAQAKQFKAIELTD